MSSQWHYARGGTQHGPLSLGELKQLAADGKLAADDLVWSEGLPDWKPAGMVDGLIPKGQAPGPPPLPHSGHSASTTAAGAASAARAFAQKAVDYARSDEAKALLKKTGDEIKETAKAAGEKVKEGAKAASDYARSDEAKEFAGKARERFHEGARVATEGQFIEKPIVVALAIIFLFPLGLYLVWRHPRWSMGQKAAWAGACFLWVCVLVSNWGRGPATTVRVSWVIAPSHQGRETAPQGA